MFLHPYEPLEEVEFDYAIIDLNLNADYFSDVKDKLISLAPDYAKKVEHSFPYLLRINQLDTDLLNEINESDGAQVKKGLNPFFLLVFKSIPTREPDIVNHLKNILVYSLSKKKYLYRFYDPRVWILLNYFNSKDFLQINRYFSNIRIGFLKNHTYFKNYKNSVPNLLLDHELIENIGVCNNVLSLLSIHDELDVYFEKVLKIFFYIDFSKKNNIQNTKDIIAFIFHALLLGDEYINTDFFREIKKSIKGYEQQSKNISSKEWNCFFDEYNFFDKDLRNKVMYDY